MIAIALGLGLMLSLFSITAAGVFRASKPELAIWLAPYDGRANAAAAQLGLLQNQSDETLERSRALAERAFRHDPTATRSYAILGALAQMGGQLDQATRIFHYSETLSRRDQETQLWLIESSVAKNDTRQALHHYDTILRSSRDLWNPLFTILSNASGDLTVAREINAVLRRKPGWQVHFLYHALGTTGSASSLYTLHRGVLDEAAPFERQLIRDIILRLVELQRHDLAWASYRDAVGEAASGLLVRDQTFRGQRFFPPFDWQFSEDAALLPELRLRERAPANMSLFLPTDSPVDGTPLRQLLHLPAGAYILSARIGEVGRDRRDAPRVLLRCARSEDVIAEAPFPQAGAEGRRMNVRFSVSADCPFQWLSVLVRGNFGGEERPQSWIDLIDIRRGA